MTRRNRITARDLRALEGYFSEMHKKAIEIMEFLGPEAEKVKEFFKRQYLGHKEQYWSVKKLYSLAMYLPMFLQIGKDYFDKVVYIDTHAGPGLAKLGSGENEIVIGSPLISIIWPQVVASRRKNFNNDKVRTGFTKYVFIEKDIGTWETLKTVVEHIAPDKNIEIIRGDSNFKLPQIAGQIPRDETLILLFVDPFGKLETQLEYRALTSIINAARGTDVVLNIMSGEIVRALTSMLSMRKLPLYKIHVKRLFGKTCEEIEDQLNLCKYYMLDRPPTDHHLPQDEIVEMYRYILIKHGFKATYIIPVEYRGERALYHLLFASKAPNANEWLGKYIIKYLRENLPRSYEELKALFLRATKTGPLDKYLYRNPKVINNAKKNSYR